ncbi:hypothetical protein [Streptomyces sp. HD]|uniref:hypothetical protein n=1 Tax=Streptomyces sp. HD TaxID=3020892 RepID=UPI00232ADEFD|nr:hypothetical protein [Streptomyces sp. HD]MDC0772729.1 hypothetical protein [Streptomyces sp. HD]
MTSPAVWPAKPQYASAVRRPGEVFADPRLSHCEILFGATGMPLASTGRNAIVFAARTRQDERVAIRCMSREPASGGERYRALTAHRHAQPVEHGTPLVEAEWIEHGIRLSGQWWPLVLMPWIEGKLLDEAVSDLCGDRAALHHLIGNWRVAMGQLTSSRICHGDLQHGNIIVGDDLRVVLVDLDAVWVPFAAHLAPGEFGHRNYQHPHRDIGHWGPGADAFPALVILLSLRAVAADPSLWADRPDGEHLLFTRDDLLAPGRTKIWKGLARSPDTAVRRLAERLTDLCAGPPDAAPPLEDVLRACAAGGPPHPAYAAS